MAITAGGSLNSVPASVQQTLASNYIDFTAEATAGWAQQYLPDLMEKEADIYGNRSISGFLAQVSAEEAMSADRVVWSEQGKADAMKDSVAKAKNVNMDPRQSHGKIEAGGLKFKVLGDDSSDFKFKIKNKNK